jgi:CBS domain-containing protein
MKELCETVMSKNIQTCRESDPVSRVAVIMRENNVGLIPVTDAGYHVTGVVTDRDLAVRVLAHNKDGDMPVGSVMSKGTLVTVLPGDTLQTAEERMIKAGVGRALVLDPHGKLLGVISRSEVAGHESEERTGKVLGALTRGSKSKAAAAKQTQK